MAEAGVFEVRIDEDAVRNQIRSILEEEFTHFGQRIRWAANVLDPEWVNEQEKWIDAEVEARVAEALEKENR